MNTHLFLRTYQRVVGLGSSMAAWPIAALAVASMVASSACKAPSSDPLPVATHHDDGSKAKAIVHGETAPDLPSSASPPADPELARRGQARWHEAPANLVDLPAFVVQQRDLAQARGHELMVYVGAAWCEPCRYFHDAVLAGRLEARLGNLHFLAFDLDRDRTALFAAGYRDGMIPLFAWPDPDGRASSHKFSGGIKGEGTIAYLCQRLDQLVASKRDAAGSAVGSTLDSTATAAQASAH